jgi:hypothetical protein
MVPGRMPSDSPSRTGPAFAVPPTMLRRRPVDEREWSGWSPMEAQAWVFDGHLRRRLPWCLDECLPTLPVPGQSFRGSREGHRWRRKPGKRADASRLPRKLWPGTGRVGRHSSIVGGTANAGPVRSRRAVSLTILFIVIVIGGRCNSMFPPTMLRRRPVDEREWSGWSPMEAQAWKTGGCLTTLSSMVTSGGACHGAWTNAFRLSQSLAKVSGGVVVKETALRLRTGPAFAVPPTMLRRRPVDEREWSGWSPMFIVIVIGGRCNSMFSASAAVVLNAPLIRHAARFCMATNGCSPSCSLEYQLGTSLCWLTK